MDTDLYLDLDPYPDPDSLETLDPDPYPDPDSMNPDPQLWFLARYSPFMVDHRFIILFNVATKQFLFCKEII